MSGVTVVMWGTVVLLCLAGILLWDILLQRARGLRRRTREDLLQARLRPLLIAYLAGDLSLEGILSAVGAGSAALEPLILDYLEKLDGAEREKLLTLAQVLGLVDSALQQLKAVDWTLRDTAAAKLGTFGAGAAVAALSERLADPAREVRYTAARSLGLIGTPAAVQALLDALDRPHLVDGARILEIVQSSAAPTAEPLRTVLFSEDFPLRSKLLAIDLAGDRRDYGSVGLLHEILQSSNKEKVVRAIRALARIGHPRSVADILERVGHREWEVRAQAVRAIGELGVEEGLPQLRSALRDPSYWVRQNAAEALLRFGPSGLTALQASQLSGDPFAKDAARYQLERAGARR